MTSEATAGKPGGAETVGESTAARETTAATGTPHSGPAASPPHSPHSPHAPDGPHGPDGDPVVTVAGLTIRYGVTLVLDEVDLSAGTGAGVCLVGENGAGKSSLLRCVAGLQEPTGGEVRVFGELPGRSARCWRDVATTVETPGWYTGLTSREHLELVCLAHGTDPADRQLDQLTATLGLDDCPDDPPAALSTGQRQRLLLCAALVRPSRLLLDEPEQRLDPTIRPTVAAILRDYLDSGGTIVMASHDPQFAEAASCRLLPVVRASADA